MKTFRVMWEIDVNATSMTDAARKARETQLDPDSAATVFDVRDSRGFGGMVDVDGTSGPERDSAKSAIFVAMVRCWGDERAAEIFAEVFGPHETKRVQRAYRASTAQRKEGVT